MSLNELLGFLDHFPGPLHCRRVSHKTLDHHATVVQAGRQLLAASVLTNIAETIRPEAAFLVDIAHGAHARTDNNLGVVSEEINLGGGGMMRTRGVLCECARKPEVCRDLDEGLWRFACETNF